MNISQKIERSISNGDASGVNGINIERFKVFMPNKNIMIGVIMPKRKEEKGKHTNTHRN